MSKERTELGVSEVREHNGMIEVDCWHPCYDEKLILKFPYCQLPKPDAASLPPETLQALIDFAHAAMSKRSDVEDNFIVTRSRKHTGGYAELTATDLRAIQQIGKPSWDKRSDDKLDDYYPN